MLWAKRVNAEALLDMGEISGMEKEALLTSEDVKRIFKKRKPGVIGRYRYFSVLLPIVEKEGLPYVLFEVRAKDMKRQPGEICFPGGMVEEGETPGSCALRETCEELGLLESDVEVVCELDCLKNYSGFTIYAFLGEIKYEALEKIRLSRGEVDEIFIVPLSYFMETQPEVYQMNITPVIDENFPYDRLNLSNNYHWRRGTMDIPIYIWEDKRIWGITGRIIRNFARIIKDEQK